jgi:hypothetical protein
MEALVGFSSRTRARLFFNRESIAFSPPLSIVVLDGFVQRLQKSTSFLLRSPSSPPAENWVITIRILARKNFKRKRLALFLDVYLIATKITLFGRGDVNNCSSFAIVLRNGTVLPFSSVLTRAASIPKIIPNFL